MKPSIREVAARHLYNADLDLSDEMSVKQIIDMMEAFGREVALAHYQQGVSDTVLGRVNNRLCGNLPDPSAV